MSSSLCQIQYLAPISVSCRGMHSQRRVNNTLHVSGGHFMQFIMVIKMAMLDMSLPWCFVESLHRLEIYKRHTLICTIISYSCFIAGAAMGERGKRTGQIDFGI